MNTRKLVLMYSGLLLCTLVLLWGYYSYEKRIILEVAVENARLRSHFVYEAIDKIADDENRLMEKVYSLVNSTDLDYIAIIKDGTFLAWESKYEGFLPIYTPENLKENTYRIINSPFYPIVEYTLKVGKYWILCGFSSFYLNELLKNTFWGMVALLVVELIVFGLTLFSFYIVEKRLRSAEIQISKEKEEAKFFRELAALSSQVAHEIKNPLNTMSIAIQLMEKEDVISEYLESLKDGVKRILEAVQKFSEIGNPIAVKKEEVEIETLLLEIINDYQEEIKKLGVLIKKEVTQKKVISDRTLLKHAIANIIKNSLDALSQKSENKVIEIRTFKEGDFVVFEIFDNGPGMSPEVLSRAFDNFFTTKGTGMGLGLGLVKRICKALGGDVVISSKEGEGTRVLIKIRDA
ncbi:MAG: sensor histidine kinase [Candidatus Hydrothermia bacterium]